jgi:hypothetical protein
MREVKRISTAQSITNKCNSLVDFTYKLTDNEGRYVVSTYPIYKGINPSLDSELIVNIDKAIKSGQNDSIGMWRGDDGKYCVDGSLHFDDLEWALKVAKAFNQKAIYDLQNDEVVYLTQSKEREIYYLLNKYAKIKDDLLDYTQHFHDAMYYDIMGYYQTLEEEEAEDIDISDLRDIVNTHNVLLKAHKSCELANYTYC